MSKVSFPPWPNFDQDEITAVAEVLSSGKVNYWTGDQGKCFEKEFAEYIGAEHAIALANGTVALELALYALGIGKGDDVIVPSRTFIASASCVVARGGRPIVADVDEVSQNISVDTIKSVLTPNTRAIIVVHLGGWPADMESIMAYAAENDLIVIEDCAQAHGAMVNSRKVGSFGDAAAFSFCQDKIMSTGGEGGMLLLKDEAAWKRAWAYKDHGKDFDAVFNQEHPKGFRWVHHSFGTNWRLTEMQSAIGRLQLKKLDAWVEKRNANANILHQKLCDTVGLQIHAPGKSIRHAYYRFYAFLDESVLLPEWNRDRIVEAISESGVACFQGSCGEIYREKAFEEAALQPAQRLPVARKLDETSICFLVHPTLCESNMNKIATVVKEVMGRAVGSV